MLFLGYGNVPKSDSNDPSTTGAWLWQCSSLAVAMSPKVTAMTHPPPGPGYGCGDGLLKAGVGDLGVDVAVAVDVVVAVVQSICRMVVAIWVSMWL